MSSLPTIVVTEEVDSALSEDWHVGLTLLAAANDPSGSMQFKSPSKVVAQDPSALLQRPSKRLAQLIEDKNEAAKGGKSKFSFLDNEKTVKLEYCMIILKPSIIYSQAAIAHISSMLQTYDVKISVKGVLPTSVVSRSKVIDTHFADLHRWAEGVPPSEGGLSDGGRISFRKVFDRDWEDCIAAGLVFNAVMAKTYFQFSRLDCSSDNQLHLMWQQTDARQRVRLQKGLYCARFDRSSVKGIAGLSKEVLQKVLLSPIYVLNGFYPVLRLQYLQSSSSSSSTNSMQCSYLVVEWDSNKTCWEDFMSKVIGDKDPALALTGSIRASLLKNWERLSISAKPTAELNCLHVSGSAFESMRDRLNWHQGSIIFSDMLGSQLVSAGISAVDIQRWLSNPVVNDRPVLDHMLGLDSEQCIQVAKALIAMTTNKHDMRNIERSSFIQKPSLNKNKDRGAVESCVIFVKPQTCSPLVVPHILSMLSSRWSRRSVRVVEHSRVSGRDIVDRNIIPLQYPDAHKYALEYNPYLLQLTGEEEDRLKKSFKGSSWSHVLQSDFLFNCAEACAHLREDGKVMYDLWERALMKIKLRKGLFLARIDADCSSVPRIRAKLQSGGFYVINGFYSHMLDSYQGLHTKKHHHQQQQQDDRSGEPYTDYFICEFNSHETSWSQMLKEVVGVVAVDSEHVRTRMPPQSTIQGSIMHAWEDLGLQPSTDLASMGNCLHVSYSAFEGMADRLRWKRHAMLFTDVLGSQLLAARFKSAQIKDWMANPEVDGRPLFSCLHGLDSNECIKYLSNLAKKR